MTRELYIKHLIKDSGYTLKSFAKEINMPYTTLLSIINGSLGGASIDNIFKICSKLGISADVLDNFSETELETGKKSKYNTDKAIEIFESLTPNLQDYAIKQLRLIDQLQNTQESE